MLFHTFGASGILKREAHPPHLPHLVAARSQHTFTHTLQGVRTMDILLLNALTVLKQATVIQNKKLVSKMLTSCSLLFWMLGKESSRIQGTISQRGFHHVVHILLLFIIGGGGGEPVPTVVLRSFVY